MKRGQSEMARGDGLSHKTGNKDEKSSKPVVSPLDPARSYTMEQLQQAAMVSRSTIYRWKRDGLQSRRVGHRNRFLGADVIKYLHGE